MRIGGRLSIATGHAGQAGPAFMVGADGSAPQRVRMFDSCRGIRRNGHEFGGTARTWAISTTGLGPTILRRMYPVPTLIAGSGQIRARAFHEPTAKDCDAPARRLG